MRLLVAIVGIFCFQLTLAEGWQGLVRALNTHGERLFGPQAAVLYRPGRSLSNIPKNGRFSHGLQSSLTPPPITSSSPTALVLEHEKQTQLPSTISAASVAKLVGDDSRFSLLVGLVEFFNVIAQTIPIVLIPVIAAEQASSSSWTPAAIVASAAAMSTFGAGVGKLVNGYVCQSLGGGKAMSIYMACIAVASLWFSFNQSTFLFVWILASMEFLLSMQWSACSAVLADHFEGKPSAFAESITILSFMCMAGVLVGKMGGAALLSVLGSWKAVARCGALVSLCGAALSHFFLREKTKVTQEAYNQQSSFFQSFKEVVSKPIFWIFAFVHGTLFLSRTSDRILGSFYSHTSGLPESLAGGLTTSITVGFLHGLSRSKLFYELPDIPKKLRFVRNNYILGAAATFGLALCGVPWLPTVIASKALRASIVAILSGLMASALSFQFFQVPGLVAPEFGRNKAVFFSLLNGAGYFSTTIVFAGLGQLLASLEGYGWSVAWLLLMGLYISGGSLLLRNFGPILANDKTLTGLSKNKSNEPN